MKYTLYDLKVITGGGNFNCSHKVGDGFTVYGENITFLPHTKQFSHYVLATLMPYIAAKQRAQEKSDWMVYESEIACPDPKCGARFTIERIGEAIYGYGE